MEDLRTRVQESGSFSSSCGTFSISYSSCNLRDLVIAYVGFHLLCNFCRSSPICPRRPLALPSFIRPGHVSRTRLFPPSTRAISRSTARKCGSSVAETLCFCGTRVNSFAGTTHVSRKVAAEIGEERKEETYGFFNIRMGLDWVVLRFFVEKCLLVQLMVSRHGGRLIFPFPAPFPPVKRPPLSSGSTSSSSSVCSSLSSSSNSGQSFLLWLFKTGHVSPIFDFSWFSSRFILFLSCSLF